jgi:isopentenyldiphosphate isomerase/tetratricopeptide (TPR) repeat protein
MTEETADEKKGAADGGQESWDVGKCSVSHCVFISYGHEKGKKGEERIKLADRLRTDLLKRGHRVWLDKKRIRPKHAWDCEILTGLEETRAGLPNAALLLLLTPYSVRRPDGYCLNEVAWALAHKLTVIPLMVVESEPPLSIYRVQWLDMQECIPFIDNEPIYREKFERLILALEEKQVDFEGTQVELRETLNPIEFKAEILELLRGFTGREWVLDKVRAWRDDAEGRKVCCIVGNPGVGKSAVAAQIREKIGRIGAFHFCDARSEEKRDPARLVCSIAYQLSTQLPEYQRRLVDNSLARNAVDKHRNAHTLFDKLIVQPLADGACAPSPNPVVVVLIDALDEAGYEGRNEIAEFLADCADRTPDWMRFLVTTRDESGIPRSLLQEPVCDLDTQGSDNWRDLERYVDRQLPDNTPGQRRAVIERSEGVFLYVEQVCKAIREGALDPARPDTLPHGLSDYYRRYFDRLVDDRSGGRSVPDMKLYREQFRAPLRVILAAKEPPPLAMLREVLGWCEEDVADLVASLGALFTEIDTANGEAIKPYHNTIGEWLVDRQASGPYFVSLREGHKALADACVDLWRKPPRGCREYVLGHALSHLIQADRHDEALSLLAEPSFVARACRLGLADSLIVDLLGSLEGIEEGTEKRTAAEPAFTALGNTFAEEGKQEGTWDHLRSVLSKTYGRKADWPQSFVQDLKAADSVSAQFFLADTDDMEKQYEKAAQCYAAIAESARDRNDHVIYAKACVKQAMAIYQPEGEDRADRFRQSLGILNHIIGAADAEKLYGNNYWRAMYHRGVIHRHTHCFEKALQDLDAVRNEMAPRGRYRSERYQQGVVRLALDQLDKAEALFNECLEQRKTRRALHRAAYEHRGLGELYALRGETDRAREALEESISISEKSGNLRYRQRARTTLAACVDMPVRLQKYRPERIDTDRLTSEFGLTSPDALCTAFRVLAKRGLHYLPLLNDRDGSDTSTFVLRKTAHADGDWHGAVAVCLFDEDGMIALQKRDAEETQSHGRWDVSASGHRDPGETALGTAVRETYEELGVMIDADRMQQVGDGPLIRKTGTRRRKRDRFDGAGRFGYHSDQANREFVTVFVARVSPGERETIGKARTDEVQEVRWESFDNALEHAKGHPDEYSSGFRQLMGKEVSARIKAVLASSSGGAGT